MVFTNVFCHPSDSHLKLCWLRTLAKLTPSLLMFYESTSQLCSDSWRWVGSIVILLRFYSTILTINSERNYELLIHQVDPDLLFFLRGSDPINLSPAPSLRSADITLNIKNKGISAAPSRKPFYCSGVQVVHLQVLSVYLSLSILPLLSIPYYVFFLIVSLPFFF